MKVREVVIVTKSFLMGTKNTLIVFVGLVGLLVFSAGALAQSPAGFVGYSYTSSPITISAGSSISDVAPVFVTSPADGFPTSMVAYRAVVYASGGSADTTLAILFPGPGENSPAITIPANRTVGLLFEAMVPVNSAGTAIHASMTLIAGSGGGLTVEPSTSLTLEGVPTYTSERELIVKSRW